MTDDAIDVLWTAQAVTLSRDIEEQMTARAADGFRPLVAALQLARVEAGRAVAALCDVDPDDAKQIRALQNEVQRFRDLVRFLHRIATAGIEAELALGDRDREDLERLVAPPRDAAAGERERETEMIRLGLG
jgi:hypothetical protein